MNYFLYELFHLSEESEIERRTEIWEKWRDREDDERMMKMNIRDLSEVSNFLLESAEEEAWL